MSSCASSLLGSACSPTVAQLTSVLDAAAEQMMIRQDFRAAFDACDSGLESLAGLDQEESRWVGGGSGTLQAVWLSHGITFSPYLSVLATVLVN